MNNIRNTDRPMSDRDFRALLKKADRLTEDSRTWNATQRAAHSREINEVAARIVREMEKRRYAPVQ